MAETKMSVELIAHTQLSEKFKEKLSNAGFSDVNDGKAVALACIRTCYSANKPSEIVLLEGDKYFKKQATDGAAGSDADRLIRQIVASKHTSTLEGITFTFAIEGVSRALLAQLTRHRIGFSYSVQSQRYVKFGSGDRSGGFDYVVPDKVADNPDAEYIFESAMEDMQRAYDKLRKAGVAAEDARAVLPNAAATNLVMTTNLRALLEFYAKRKPGNGAQAEIAELAERLKDEVIAVEPWTAQFFAN
jgi:thymidylate synthase (FAD)